VNQPGQDLAEAFGRLSAVDKREVAAYMARCWEI
jgi:hypothetical protein